MPRKTSNKKVVVRDSAFAKRLADTCDNFGVPPLHEGRYTWIVKHLKDRFGMDVSTESVRKWYSGEVRPRRRPMSYLAQLFQVDEGWLSIDSRSEAAPAEVKVRDAMADGAVNLVAGMIRMHGGSVAFPDPSDKTSRDVDIFAIIKGAQFKFKVTVGEATGRTVRFVVPSTYRDLFVVGLVETGPFSWDLLELDASTIDAHRSMKSGQVEIEVERHGASYQTGKDKLRKLNSFRERP